MEKSSLPKATLGRIPRYLAMLRELSPEKVPYISATAISRELKLGEVQVRKDLAAISGAGKPRLGYATEDLVAKLEDCLGYNKLTPAVLVGAGRLGRALLHFDGFKHFGVDIIAAFDANRQIPNPDPETEVLPMDQFRSFCGRHNIRLGIITVGEGSAQDVCDQMVASGITAIWNFAPCKLHTPADILLQNENLALSLAHLSNQLSCREEITAGKAQKQEVQ